MREEFLFSLKKKLTKEQGGFESVRKRRSGGAGGGYEGT
jgi:hypothetical protein